MSHFQITAKNKSNGQFQLIHDLLAKKAQKESAFIHNQTFIKCETKFNAGEQYESTIKGR